MILHTLFERAKVVLALNASRRIERFGDGALDEGDDFRRALLGNADTLLLGDLDFDLHPRISIPNQLPLLMLAMIAVDCPLPCKTSSSKYWPATTVSGIE